MNTITIADHNGGTPGDSIVQVFMDIPDANKYFRDYVKKVLELKKDLPDKSFDSNEIDEDERCKALLEITGCNNFNDFSWNNDNIVSYDMNDYWGTIEMTIHKMCPKCERSENACNCINEMKSGDVVMIEDDAFKYRRVFETSCDSMLRCNGHTFDEIKEMQKKHNCITFVKQQNTVDDKLENELHRAKFILDE